MKFKSLLLSILIFSSILINAQSHIILLGPPGSGKGTLAQNLRTKFDYEHICIGDLLRTEIKNKTELGKSIEEKVRRGEYIDVGITAQLISRRVTEVLQANRFFIIDGFPRSFACIEYLDAIMQKYELKASTVCIALEAKDATCIERICGRLVCFDCYNVYNSHTHGLKESDPCPDCTSPLTRRLNDDDEAVVNRLTFYRKEIAPVVEHMKDTYKTFCIHTCKDIVECLNECFKILGLTS